MSSHKVLVCGASGIVGRSLCQLLQSYGITYVGTYHKNKVANAVRIDFETNAIDDLINEFQPTVIVNCIVERYVDVCEQDWNTTKETNITIPAKLAKISADRNIYLIHLSTDYVFDGKSPPYFPYSSPNPLQNYGISKLISEYRVQSLGKHYTVIRVPVLYTDCYKDLSETAVTLIGKKVMNRVETFAEDGVSIRRPVFIADLCKYICQLIETPDTSSKILHFYNSKDAYTKYDIAGLIASILQKDASHIRSQTTFADMSERPIDTRLIDPSMTLKYKHPITQLCDGLQRCFQRFAHKPLHECLPQDVFIMLDLDGTLIDSEHIHYKCYKEALQEVGVPSDAFTFDMFVKLCNEPGESIDNFILHTLNCDLEEVKQLKQEKMRVHCKDATFMNGMEYLIHMIHAKGLPHVVVTNTSNASVDAFKEALPSLKLLTNWVSREHYKEAKPNQECYEKAKQLYYKNEKHIVIFENTVKGMLAAKQVSDIVYVVTSKDNPYYNYFKQQDVYLIKEFSTYV